MSVFLSIVVLPVLKISHQRPAQRDHHGPPWRRLHHLLRHGAVDYITHSPHSLCSVDGRLNKFSAPEQNTQ